MNLNLSLKKCNLAEQEMKVRVKEVRCQAIEAEAEVPKAMAQAFRDGNLEIYLNISRMKMKNLDDKKRGCRCGYNHSNLTNGSIIN